jgi:hypothetical protein
MGRALTLQVNFVSPLASDGKNQLGLVLQPNSGVTSLDGWLDV